MSIFKSYFSKNNTLLYNSTVNTGRNPVIELSFGSSDYLSQYNSFTRFIFNIDLTELLQNIQDGVISLDCSNSLTHTLHMTNTSSFDEDLLNTKMSNQKRRATSFDLILFRIPKTSGSTGNVQRWDEGVGYDYSDLNLNKSANIGELTPLTKVEDNSYSLRPSNWYQRQTLKNWSENGIYNNKNNGLVNFSGLTIVDTQHFEFGNEDISFDMTSEINDIISGVLSIDDVAGWGIAFYPELENITGLTESYCVGFFSRHTQTFYKPYLQTTYDDSIKDDRNNFVKGVQNKLYLYTYMDGDLVNLDYTPFVTIKDNNDTTVAFDLTTCLKTKGIYELTVPNSFNSFNAPCDFTDTWTGLMYNGQPLPNIENTFVLKNTKSRIEAGIKSWEPELFGFDFYGIKQNEKILNTDIRKIGVIIKKAYTTQTILNNIKTHYRVFVKEGQTEVQVQDWTEINRTPNEYYFIFDTRDKIPNQYYVDIKVDISGQKDTYKRQLTFQIVNKK